MTGANSNARFVLEVATTRLELESALEAIVAADASADAAAAWEEASSERYAAGLAMLSELLDAQADLTAAEIAQVRVTGQRVAGRRDASVARWAGDNHLCRRGDRRPRSWSRRPS